MRNAIVRPQRDFGYANYALVGAKLCYLRQRRRLMAPKTVVQLMGALDCVSRVPMYQNMQKRTILMQGSGPRSAKDEWTLVLIDGIAVQGEVAHFLQRKRGIWTMSLMRRRFVRVNGLIVEDLSALAKTKRSSEFAALSACVLNLSG